MMLDDTTRLQYTVEQVLRAGVAGQRRKLMHRAPGRPRGAGRRVHRDGAAPPSPRRRRGQPRRRAAGGVDDGRGRRRRAAHRHRQPARQRGEVPRPTRCSITVELASPSPDTLWVRVRDRGVGIPRRQLRRIFNRFYRFQARGSNVKGTGLGLYMVRSIARQHGGRAFAESEGEGQRRHLHAGAAEAGAAGRRHEPHPGGRGRAAPRRRPQVQPRGRRPRGGRHRRRQRRRWRTCRQHRDAYDAVVLDVMLPGKQRLRRRPGAARRQRLRADPDAHRPRPARGRARRLRERRRRLPAEAVRAGDPAGAGARPAAPEAVAARAGAGLGRWWRRRPAPPTCSEFAGHRLDMRALELHANGRAYRLTVMEADLLAYLVRHAGAGRLAQDAARRRLGPARGHRHARHRQLHRPAAALPGDATRRGRR